MKAAYFNSHGGPEVIQYGEYPAPEIGDDEVLVKIHYASLNHLDIWAREGLPGLDLKFPFISGSDFAGEVVEVGEKVIDFSVGDHVGIYAGIYCDKCSHCKNGEQSMCDSYLMIGEHVNGGMAEYAKVPARNLHLIPKKRSCKRVAAGTLTTLTAYRMLVTKGGLKYGDKVLIPGGTGGLSVAAIQIAKYLGGYVVTTTSTEEKVKRLQDLGADLVINYNEIQGWRKVILQTIGEVDLVIESNGGDVFAESIRCLRKGGTLVTAGATVNRISSVLIPLIFWKQLELKGSTMSNMDEYHRAVDMIVSNAVSPIIDKVFNLENLRIAEEYMMGNDRVGKVVIRVHGCPRE